MTGARGPTRRAAGHPGAFVRPGHRVAGSRRAVRGCGQLRDQLLRCLRPIALVDPWPLTARSQWSGHGLSRPSARVTEHRIHPVLSAPLPAQTTPSSSVAGCAFIILRAPGVRGASPLGCVRSRMSLPWVPFGHHGLLVVRRALHLLVTPGKNLDEVGTFRPFVSRTEVAMRALGGQPLLAQRGPCFCRRARTASSLPSLGR